MLADAVVLAAGKSTRIARVGGGLPKPLLPVQGEPILVRNIRWLAGAGVRHIWVNLHYRGDLIRAALGDGSTWGVEVRYSEEPTILGTAGGVRKVLSSLGDTFLVVYGDNLLELDLAAFSAAHRARGADVSIALFDDTAPNTGIAGGRVMLDANDRVTAFREGAEPLTPPSPFLTPPSPFPTPPSPFPSFINAGVYAVERPVFEEFPEGEFLDWGRDVFPLLIERGCRIFGYRIEGYCLAMDTPACYERGMALISSGQVRLT